MFGKYIKELRESNDLTIDELATKCSMTSVAIRYIEKGDVLPRIENLKKLADALKVDYDMLYDKYLEERD